MDSFGHVSVVSAPDGVRIVYDVQGAGPPIVLVHGITESRRAWDPIVHGLAASHLVVAVDLRGHGESERRPPYDALTMAIDLDAVVSDAGAAGPLVVGHSLGAAVASLFASMYPARGVVNIDQPLELASFKQLIAPLEPQLRGDEATFLSAMEAIFEPLYGALPAAERARIDGTLSRTSSWGCGSSCWRRARRTSMPWPAARRERSAPPTWRCTESTPGGTTSAG